MSVKFANMNLINLILTFVDVKTLFYFKETKTELLIQLSLKEIQKRQGEVRQRDLYFYLPKVEARQIDLIKVPGGVVIGT
jgi:hypothetical protein